MRLVALLMLSAGIMFAGCNAETGGPGGSTSTVGLSGSLESWAGTQAELDTLVAEGKPVVLDFYADW